MRMPIMVGPFVTFCDEQEVHCCASTSGLKAMHALDQTPPRTGRVSYAPCLSYRNGLFLVGRFMASNVRDVIRDSVNESLPQESPRPPVH